MALEVPARPIASPADELAYLRAQVAMKEAELLTLKQERPREEIAHERILHHRMSANEEVLAPAYRMTDAEAANHSLTLDLDPEQNDETIAELRGVMEEKGVHNAFTILEKLNNPHLEDDFHRFLVQYLVAGMQPKGLGENQPEWKALHMTLYEISLPEMSGESKDGRVKTLKELVSSMEQFYSGMLAVENAGRGEPPYMTLELAVPVDKPHLMFYAAIPNTRRDLFEKQLLAIFPNASVIAQPNDYNVFVENGFSHASVASFKDKAMLPLKDYQDFDYDPLNSLLNAFAKVAPEDEGVSLQIVFKPQTDHYVHYYRRVLHALRQGEHRSRAFTLPETFVGDLAREAFGLIATSKKQSANEPVDQKAIEMVEKKIQAPVVSTNIRLVVSTPVESRTQQILSELESSFNQFEHTTGNRLEFLRPNRAGMKQLLRDFSFRLFRQATNLPLSLRELTTMYHFPPNGIESAPNLKQSRFAAAAAPADLPHEGTSIGTNTFRGQTTEVRIAPEDRLRHLYAIGQTGAGKTGFLKTLIEQDIKAGNGVCFIDPHGNDILDVLAMIPPERYEDVIYFDPANIDRPFGLNMLEYDPNRPEQKTFIVNEMLAIFRQLYGDVPESMGPAFEQYFRNATQLVMEDPSSGSTLMDIGRVLSNKPFRDLKLSRSNNPIINQFWNEIATQAEGEASLQNIVPYITNKFDEFTGSDFMRPIIGQQESSFKFREVIDTKKILLVNLSKGRLGERNANLLGLIIVGKLFMAALSRVDDPRGNFPPFYLYIDEFQNITTNSIPGILSEARKYKLSLTIAHQYLAQIDEKIRDAVFGNVGSMAVFRVGQEDGEFFGKLFAPSFAASDFINIENRNAYVRILARGVPQKPFNIKTLDLAPGNLGQVDDLRELSYLTYGRDRATVEASIRARYLS
ncbi:MAG: putative Type IV secretory pathway VirD4 component [Parcubacteria bacterium C7867-004]|nr:MAG: putative Type IV secretory pathway VirD4 component [Parcubacteria bacterium C7867-004]